MRRILDLPFVQAHTRAMQDTGISFTPRRAGRGRSPTPVRSPVPQAAGSPSPAPPAFRFGFQQQAAGVSESSMSSGGAPTVAAGIAPGPADVAVLRQQQAPQDVEEDGAPPVSARDLLR